MKKLLISLAIVTSLSGCAVWDAYWLAGYDNQEYALVNKIRSISEYAIDECINEEKSNESFNALYKTAIELRNFAQYIPNNPDSYKLAGNLVELTKQGKEMYDKNPGPSPAFCKLKLKSINRAAEVAQEVIGKKTR